MQDITFEKVAETVRDGFATAHKLSGLPGNISGCIYRADYSKVTLSERLGGHKGDHVHSQNPETAPRPETAKRLSGRGIYLGHYMGGHYGHFITETLSSFWFFEEEPAQSFDYILFHPFIFGEATPDYARFCLNRFGIDEKRIVFVDTEPLLFDELVVPERLFRLNHSADPRLHWVYDHIAGAAPEPTIPRPQIYLSRRRLSRRNFQRVVANEVEIEAAFRARGFEVLYPETMTFAEQVAHYHHAEVLAGISGSGLHNALFMERGAKVIELGDPRYLGLPAPTQELCNVVAAVDASFIPFRGAKFGKRLTMLFDVAFLNARLDAIFGNPDDRAPRRKGRTVLQLLEIAYLTVRPSLGGWVRDLLNMVRGG
jgi:hypothetical protein